MPAAHSESAPQTTQEQVQESSVSSSPLFFERSLSTEMLPGIKADGVSSASASMDNADWGHTRPLLSQHSVKVELPMSISSFSLNICSSRRQFQI